MSEGKMRMLCGGGVWFVGTNRIMGCWYQYRPIRVHKVTYVVISCTPYVCETWGGCLS